MPWYLGALEKRVTENDSADGWLYVRWPPCLHSVA